MGRSAIVFSRRGRPADALAKPTLSLALLSASHHFAQADKSAANMPAKRAPTITSRCRIVALLSLPLNIQLRSATAASALANELVCSKPVDE